MTTPNDLLFGSGAKSCSFGKPGDQPGAMHSGVILSVGTVQRTNFQTKQPEFWDDGRPKMQIALRIQTAERDPADLKDDGIRTLFVRGGKQMDAVRAAVEAVEAPELEVGATITVQWTGVDTDGQTRLWAAGYQRPTPETLAIAAQSNGASATAQQQVMAPAQAAPAQQVLAPPTQPAPTQQVLQPPAQNGTATPAPVQQAGPRVITDAERAQFRSLGMSDAEIDQRLAAASA